MKSFLMLLLVGLAVLAVGIGSGFTADEAKKVPLNSVYTTTRQKDTKDAMPLLC